MAGISNLHFGDCGHDYPELSRVVLKYLGRETNQA